MTERENERETEIDGERYFKRQIYRRRETDRERERGSRKETDRERERSTEKDRSK